MFAGILSAIILGILAGIITGSLQVGSDLRSHFLICPYKSHTKKELSSGEN